MKLPKIQFHGKEVFCEIYLLMISRVFLPGFFKIFWPTVQGHTKEKILECPLDDTGEILYLDKEGFRKLLELATLDSYFFFNGEIYKQIDGVAMGSPLGSTLANVFMCHMEKKWLRDCPEIFKPVMYKRYVDDSFLLFNSDNHMNLFLNYLNSQHPNISFTSEVEKNCILPFLDIKIQRNEQTFTTSIYGSAKLHP